MAFELSQAYLISYVRFLLLP